jgi:hypothetical protein
MARAPGGFRTWEPILRRRIKRQGAMDHLRKPRPHEAHDRERSRDRRERSDVPHSARPMSLVKIGQSQAQVHRSIRCRCHFCLWRQSCSRSASPHRRSRLQGFAGELSADGGYIAQHARRSPRTARQRRKAGQGSRTRCIGRRTQTPCGPGTTRFRDAAGNEARGLRV